MKRGFKKLDGNATIPERATEHSAGYDISSSETVTIQPDEIKMVSTGLAVQLGDDEVLKLYDRSSNPVKRGIALINSVGIIDSDYYPQEFKGLFMKDVYKRQREHNIRIIHYTIPPFHNIK